MDTDGLIITTALEVLQEHAVVIVGDYIDLLVSMIGLTSIY